MARFNEILSGRFNRALQKYFSMKGGPPAAQLASEIAPNFQFNQMGVDFRYLEGWNRFFASSAGTVGNAGNSPTFRLTNDAGTNVIAVIEKLLVGTVAADKIDITFQNNQPLVSGHVPNLGTILPSLAMDQRQQGTSLTQQSVLTASTSVVTNTAGVLAHKRQSQAGVDIDVITHEDGQIVMLPQTLLNIFSEAAASTLFVSVIWRERFLEDSERT